MRVKPKTSPEFCFREFLKVDNAPEFIVALSSPIPNGCLLVIGSSGSASMIELRGGIPSRRIGEGKKGAPLLACIVLDPETREVFVASPSRTES